MKKVLVVEDDVFIRDISSIKLSEHGYEVTAVENGESAIKSLQSKELDAVLLDLDLPDISGLEILSTVRASKNLKIQKLPVIVFSNQDDDAMREKLSQLGITGYFIKASTDFSEIFDIIDSLA